MQTLQTTVTPSTTIHNVPYENIKLQFVADLRKHLKLIQDDLTDDFTAVPDDDPNGETFEECLDSGIFRFFIPFSELVNSYLDFQFLPPNSDANSWEWMREKFVDLTKFVLKVFEPTAKVMDEVMKSHNYSNLLIKFDEEVIKDLVLH